MLYFVYLISLFMVVFISPALAVFPGLIRTPLNITAIPIVSVFIIYLTTTFLLNIACFTPQTVSVVGIIFSGIAYWRTRNIGYLEEKKNWLWLGWLLLLLLPYFIKLGTTAFDSGDEIYSWNVWAMQYVYGWTSPDFYNVTNAAYPQLFPKLLAFGYQWLGDTALQLPLKASLGILPLSLLGTLIFVETNTSIWSRVLLVLLLVFGAGIERYFDYAYADPLMTTALIVSIAHLWEFQKKQKNDALIVCVISALVAAHTKQPGLTWSLWGLPVMLLLLKQKQSIPSIIAAILALLGGSLVWLLGQGSGFHENGGVISASFAGREIGAQLLHSAQTYLLYKPAIGLLLIGALLIARRHQFSRQLLLVWLLPSMVLWFLYGAYDLRLGMHIVSAMAVIWSIVHWPKIQFSLKSVRYGFAVTLLMSMLASGWVWQKSLLVKTNSSPYVAGQVALAKYFGKDSRMIFEQLYDNPSIQLWTPTDYVLGLFYMHTQVYRPNWGMWDPYISDPITEDMRRMLIEELNSFKPDYVFTSGRLPVRGEKVSQVLEQLANEYPGAFEVIAGPQNRHGYYVYRVHYDILENILA